MESLGKSEIIVDSTIVGEFDVEQLYADEALYPRLGIRASCFLLDKPDRRISGDSPLVGYEMPDLSGDLRLDRAAVALGPIYWAGHRGNVRSVSNHASRAQLSLLCDLDPWRLERIEEQRAGGELRLAVDLWPTLVRGDGRHLNAHISRIRLAVPRDQWLKVLEGFKYGCFEIIEARFDPAELERFQPAVEYTRAARGRIPSGDYNEAVGTCRKAVEILKPELGEKAQAIREALAVRMDVERAKEYARILAALKKLVNIPHHRRTEPVTYSRAEALFVVRTTENLLALIADRTRTA